MATLGFQIQWEWHGHKGGSEVFEAAINEFLAKLENKEPLFRSITSYVLEPQTKEQFYSQGSIGDTPWDALADSTVKKRAKKGLGPEPILVESTRLVDSFTTGGDDNINEFNAYEGEWGSSVPYAPLHQSGTSRMPSRPILFINEKTIADIEAQMGIFAQEAATGIFQTESNFLPRLF